MLRTVPRAREEDRTRRSLAPAYRAIHAVIRRIPAGRVATYGQVAELAGFPGGGRVAAAALKVSKPADSLPWYRVIGTRSSGRGRIAILDPVGAAIQQQMLEREGVEVSDRGTIALDEFGWLPRERRKRGRRQLALSDDA
jgi:methylated-DNA-protein-cysteine methyltransferase-like protein